MGHEGKIRREDDIWVTETGLLLVKSTVGLGEHRGVILPMSFESKSSQISQRRAGSVKLESTSE